MKWTVFTVPRMFRLQPGLLASIAATICYWSKSTSSILLTLWKCWCMTQMKFNLYSLNLNIHCPKTISMTALAKWNTRLVNRAVWNIRKITGLLRHWSAHNGSGHTQQVNSAFKEYLIGITLVSSVTATQASAIRWTPTQEANKANNIKRVQISYIIKR